MPSNRGLSDLLSGRSSINVSVWGKNKNTNHHSKCTCYFPSGVRNWIASESRENAADGLGLELVSPHAVGREEETWHGSWPVWRGWALRGPIPRSWRSPPHCQMPDAAGAAVLAVPVAPVHSGKQRLTLSVCRHSCNPAAVVQGEDWRGMGIQRLLVLLPSCADWASHSPRIRVSASQSHRQARGPGKQTALCLHMLSLGFRMPPSRRLRSVLEGMGA